jgi:hypothetical protein
VITWEQLSTLPPLRDAMGTIVLEEADDDTRSARFRVYGRAMVTVTLGWDGVHFDGEVPPKLRAALAPPEFGRFVAAGSGR